MTTKTEGHKQYPNTRPGCPHMDIMLSCTISPTFSGIYMYVSWEWAWGLYNISLPAFNFAIWDRGPGDQTNECMNPYILALGCSLNLDQSQGKSCSPTGKAISNPAIHVCPSVVTLSKWNYRCTTAPLGFVASSLPTCKQGHCACWASSPLLQGTLLSVFIHVYVWTRRQTLCALA